MRNMFCLPLVNPNKMPQIYLTSQYHIIVAIIQDIIILLSMTFQRIEDNPLMDAFRFTLSSSYGTFYGKFLT